MKVLELFSGTESFSKVARERGHETFTVDWSRTGLQGVQGFRKNRNQKHPVDISRYNGIETKWSTGAHINFIKENQFDGSARALRSVVPKELCLEIIKACEEKK